MKAEKDTESENDLILLCWVSSLLPECESYSVPLATLPLYIVFSFSIHLFSDMWTIKKFKLLEIK